MNLSALKRDKRYPLLVFLGRLLALAIPLYLIMWFGDLYFFQDITAMHSEFVINAMGMNVTRNGPEMRAGDFRFFISKDSTAWKTMLFLFALIIAVPKIPWRKRLMGIIIGLPLLYIGNLGRIVSIVLAEKNYGIDVAMVVHDWGWRVGLVAMVLIVWVIWLKLVSRECNLSTP